MRARRDAITDENVLRVIEEGSAKARAIAATKMTDVRQKVGVSLT